MTKVLHYTSIHYYYFICLGAYSHCDCQSPLIVNGVFAYNLKLLQHNNNNNKIKTGYLLQIRIRGQTNKLQAVFLYFYVFTFLLLLFYDF